MKNKKLVSLLSLVLVVMFAVTGLGAIRIGRFNKDFDELWPLKVSFGDSREKVEEVYGDDCEVMPALNDEDERTVMIYETSDGEELIIRLDDDALSSIRLTADFLTESSLATLEKNFGKADEVYKDLDMWCWRGKVHGEKCLMWFSYDPVDKDYSLSFEVA